MRSLPLMAAAAAAALLHASASARADARATDAPVAAAPAMAAAPTEAAPAPVVSLTSPLSPSDGPRTAGIHPAAVELRSDERAWRALPDAGQCRIESLPVAPGMTVDVDVHRANPTLDARIVGAELRTDGSVIERELPPSSASIWIGQVAGEAGSSVVLSRSAHFTYGYVEWSGGTAFISSGRVGSGLPTVAFRAQDVGDDALRWAGRECIVLAPPDGGAAPEGGVAGAQPCRQARIGIETDTEFLSLFGGNAQAATDYVATLFAAANFIYARDLALHPNLVFLRLWTSGSDPWTTNTSSAALPEFRDYWQGTMSQLSRATAHMLSGRGLGGGIAWLGSVCGSYSYAVSGNLGGSFPYPVADNSGQNWDLMVFSHELGHNLGSPHTHSETPIADGCGLDPRDCTVATAGQATIMSYCHLCPGGIANMRMRFHEYSVESMEGFLGGTGCDLTGPTEPPLSMADRLTLLQPATLDLDVLANDLPFNCEAVSIASLISTSPDMALELLPGAGPEGRDLVRATVTGHPGTTHRGSYRIRDTSAWWSQPTDITVDVLLPRQPENPSGDVPGLQSRFYVLQDPDVLPDLASMTPYLTSSAARLDYPSTGGNFADSGRADNVGALYTGWISIPSAGWWTLYTDSDDGSKLWIGDQLVVVNDGLHGMREIGGQILLAPGRHAITVGFFERGGGAGLRVSWQGPGTPKGIVPAVAWSQGGSFSWTDINRDGSINALDIAALLAAWGSWGGPADVTRNGTVDGTDLAAVLAAWTG